MGKFDKHIAFMDNLVNRWEWTEAERTLLYQSEPVKYYASNVVMLGTVTGEQFFEERPEWAARIEKAMALAEAEQKEKAQVKEATGEVAQLKSAMEALRNTVAAQAEELKALKEAKGADGADADSKTGEE